jgi:protease-4
VIDKGYRDFTGRVAKARKRTVEQVDQVARGRVWSGAQAKERGLVDAFGGLQDAIGDAATRAKLGKEGEYRVRYIEKMATPFQRFFSGLAGSRIGGAWLRHSEFAREMASVVVLANAVPQARRDLQFLDAAIARPGQPVKALAYCFCGF